MQACIASKKSQTLEQILAEKQRSDAFQAKGGDTLLWRAFGFAPREGDYKSEGRLTVEVANWARLVAQAAAAKTERR